MTNGNKTTYHDLVDAVQQKYKSRIETFLDKVRTFLQADGFPCTEVEEDNIFDEYKWRFLTSKVTTKGFQQYEITLIIAESFAHGDGYEGIGFHIEVMKFGQEVCTFKPFNYTDRCWVDVADTQAIEERWKLIEDGYPMDDLLKTLKE